MPDVELPPLAAYKSIKDYMPEYGDYVTWSRWFSTWHGVVSNYDVDANEVHIIFEGTPYLLFTLDHPSFDKYTYKKNLNKIRNSTRSSWAVLRHDAQHNATIWYI